MAWSKTATTGASQAVESSCVYDVGKAIVGVSRHEKSTSRTLDLSLRYHELNATWCGDTALQLHRSHLEIIMYGLCPPFRDVL